MAVMAQGRHYCDAVVLVVASVIGVAECVMNAVVEAAAVGPLIISS